MFYKIIVDSWEDAVSLFDKITDKFSTWAFRGQPDESLDLTTKFEREARKYNKITPYWFKNRENIILRDFKRRAHHYIQNLPDRENNIEWLALIQHYGGPTRLLDFTYSPYVAAFFAMESSSADSAIWVVNISKLEKQLSKISGTDSIEKEHTFEGKINIINALADAVIKERKNIDVVYPIEPFQQHERISIQQGLFLFPCNIEERFEHNLCSVLELGFKELSDMNAKGLNCSEIDKLDALDISIIKIIIPLSLHSKALIDLSKMNVTAATLFPGLDGFSRSLSYFFPELDYLLSRNV